jgi:hypothetical protein
VEQALTLLRDWHAARGGGGAAEGGRASPARFHVALLDAADGGGLSSRTALTVFKHLSDACRPGPPGAVKQP